MLKKNIGLNPVVGMYGYTLYAYAHAPTYERSLFQINYHSTSSVLATFAYHHYRCHVSPTITTYLSCLKSYKERVLWCISKVTYATLARCVIFTHSNFLPMVQNCFSKINCNCSKGLPVSPKSTLKSLIRQKRHTKVSIHMSLIQLLQITRLSHLNNTCFFSSFFFFLFFV